MGRFAVDSGIYVPRDGKITHNKCRMWGSVTGLTLARRGLILRKLRRKDNWTDHKHTRTYTITELGKEWLRAYK